MSNTAGEPRITREPWLTESVVAVRAPAMAIAARDGQIRQTDDSGYRTAHGYYDQDQRILSLSVLTINGEHPEYLGHRLLGAGASLHVCAVRTAQDPTPDPVLIVECTHHAGSGQKIMIENRDRLARALDVRLHVAADLADVSDVRRGEPREAGVIVADTGSVGWQKADGGASVSLAAVPAPEVREQADRSAILFWEVTIPPGRTWTADVLLHARVETEALHPLRALSVEVPWKKPEDISDRRLKRLVHQGLDDLQALLLAPAGDAKATFVAAGVPWYLTLFGRDSLWTARLLLSLDEKRDLAYGTLSVLGGLQGEKTDAGTDEEFGKILHELRSRTTKHQQGEVLPPLYYGSMDATALFVLLLVDAFEAGMDRHRVEKLIPHARDAMTWMRRRSGGDKAPEFIRYEAHSSGALFNHGWKDSADAIVDEQGENVAGSVALSEVQAYAIDAARRFAKLLLEIEGEEAEAEAAVLRRWADELVSRFLEAFVVDDGPGEPYFAIALDRDDKAVKGLTSNIGHLLGTGILSPVQSAALARHLVSDELFSGWGVRTRSSAHPRFNRLSYHGGAVWAHDTAIAIRGLALAAAEAADAKDPVSARACGGAARTLAGGLIDAAHAFDYRLPELFGGGPREAGDIMPLPFPAACRPQAWSAAAGVAVYEALKRLDALDEVLVSS